MQSPCLASRERDRVEMYLLSADGLTVLQLARHFGRCEAARCRWIHQFEEEGLKAVRHRQDPERAAAAWTELDDFKKTAVPKSPTRAPSAGA